MNNCASTMVSGGAAASRPTMECLEQLYRRTLEAISLDRIIPQQVACHRGVLETGGEKTDLLAYRRIFTIAIGKAAYQMVDVLSGIVAPIELTGVISGLSPTPRNRPGFLCFQGGHPYPNADSLRAGRAAIELLETATPKDLVLYVLSGGGSAICEAPLFEDISLADCREFYRLLVTCGANIVDVNFIRKRFSAIKGGRLAQLAYPARQVTLYVSDAPPDRPSNVASGPSMPDESSNDQCCRIMARIGMEGLPRSIARRFERGEIAETPKAGDEIFQSSSWHCLLSPGDATEELTRLCRESGWVVETDLSVDDDCPRQQAIEGLLERLKRLQHSHPGRPVAVVTGGEYSCPVTGDGVGGRNQAFVLDCVPKISGTNVVVLSAGTDGIDGTSPAAGATADGDSLRRAKRLGLDPLEFARRSDSYGFFSRLGDALITGPTGNNVRDVRILAAF